MNIRDFKDSFEQYFNKDSILRYYLFDMFIGGIDGLSKNFHLCSWDGQIFYCLPYDLDSCLGGTNTGYLRVPASCEVGILYDTDGVTILEENHFNSWNSRLWARVRSTFSVDLNNMYTTLRSNGLFTLENMLSYFERVWEVIPPKMYNESQQIKYINDGATGMVALHGNRKLQIKKWLRERIAYLDSKFGYYAGGGTNEQYVNFRMNYQGAVSLDISTYYTVYAKVRWASKNEQVIRIAKGQKKTFSYYSDVGTDREVMIMLPESLKTIENISNIHPNSIDISKATKLTEIEAHNPNLFSVDLSKNKYLRKVDFNGCERLGTETATMTLNYCKYLNYVDLRNTKITAVTFNNKGGSLRKIYYPTTIQSINLMNQGLLTDMILPYGEDGSKAPVDLATINIENCPNINKLIDLSSDPTSLNGMRYCRNLTLNNSIKLTRFNFYGFTRLANVNLQNMDTLEEVDFLNMAEVGQQSSLRYIGVSACPKMATISMNVDDPNYEITWADQGILDLQTAGGVRNIYSNCIIKGLTTILLPVTIENMYFTNEYGSGYSDIENIWSPASATVSKTGVYPVAYHLDDNNEVDDFIGMDLKGSHLYNIDLGALVNIPEAINFSLYPTNTNPNFNKNRDGETLPYLKPIGTLDLSNYTESLAKFFNGVDLDVLQLVCTNILPQTDFSYCFYNSTFTTLEAINPVLEKMSMVSNASHMFDNTIIDNIDVLSNIAFLNGAIIDYMFANTRVTNIDGFSLKNNISSAEGLFDGCVLITSANNMNLNVKGKINNFLRGAKVLATMNNLTLGTAVTSAEYFVANCPKLLSATNMKLNVRGSLAHFAESDRLLSSITGTVTPNTTDTSYMFNGCGNLSEYIEVIPSTCENFGHMYSYTAITEIDGMTVNYNSNAVLNNSKINDRVLSIFEGCDLTRVDNFSWDYLTGYDAYGLFKDMINLEYIYIITGNHCSSLANLAYGTAVKYCKIDGNSFTSLKYSFRETTSNSIDLTIDTSNVTSMIGTFYNSKITSLDVSSWNTSKLQYLTDTFRLSSIERLDLTSWNTSEVVAMDSFLKDSKITELDMNNCNLSKLNNMDTFIFGCRSIKNINMSNINFNSLTRMYQSFSGINKTDINIDFSNSSFEALTNASLVHLGGRVNFSNCIIGTDKTNFSDRSFITEFTTEIILDSATIGNLIFFKNRAFTVSKLKLSVNNMDLSAFTDFTSAFENCCLGDTDFNNVIFSENNKLIFDYAFRGSNVKSDIQFPVKVASCIECYKDCTSLIDAHRNWEQSYFYGITPTNCYSGCVNLTNIDGVCVVNDYSTGLDDVPTDWGGYGFFKWCTGIYKIDTTLLGQDAEGNDILTVNLTNHNNTTYDNGVVNWGDGTVTDKTVYSHTYARPGVYVIKTKRQPGGTGYGTCADFQKCMTEIIQYPTDFSPQGVCYNCKNVVSAKIENNIINSRTRSGTINTVFTGSPKLKDIVLTFAEDVYPTAADRIFMSCPSLETVDLSTLNMSKMERMSEWFRDCPNLTSITGLQPVTSYTTNITGLFRGSSNLDLNNVENISDWDVSGVTIFDYLFSDSIYMTGWECVQNWNTSKGTSFKYTFNNTSLTDETLQYVLNWNFSSALDVSSILRNNKGLTTIDLSSWDWSNIEKINEAVRDCAKVTNIVMPNNLDKVLSADGLFAENKAMITFTLPTLPSLQTMPNLCQGCGSLTTFDWTPFSNNSNITNISFAFNNCIKLKTMTGQENLDFSNLQLYHSTFAGDTLLETELDLTTLNKGNELGGFFGHLYYGCDNLAKVSKLRLINKLAGIGASYFRPFNGSMSNLNYIEEYDVTYTQSFAAGGVRGDDLLLTNDYWIGLAWQFFNGFNNLTHIGFTGTFYSDNSFSKYQIFKGCLTTKLDSATWKSLANCFPDNTGSGVEKYIWLGNRQSSVADENIALFTNKGYTVIFEN